MGKISDEGISNSWISGQSLIKGNCHNPRTSDGIDMKLGPVTKLDKRNKITLRNFDDDVVTINCGVIVILPIYAQFDSIRMPILQSFFLQKLKTELKNL